MSTNKLNKKLIKNANNRELLYAEAQEKVISKQRQALKNKQKKTLRTKQFNNTKSLFNSFSHTKPTDFRALYYKTLSRNFILDISDKSHGSPFILLSSSLRNSIVESSGGPVFEKRELHHVNKHIENTKTTNRVLQVSLRALQSITKKDRDTAASVSVYKFLIKKHLEQAYLFEKSLVKSYSECDYVVKFWGPLVEKVFKTTSIIPHWGDTIPGSITSLGMKMKMDLRLVVTNSSELQDHGYGEVAEKCSTSKYFKDKRKTVVASKALLNSIVQQNAINHEEDCVYIPYLIAMGFDMHLCVVFLKSNNFYITKKVKTIIFPSTLENFAKESIEVVNGLLDLVAMCEAIQKQSCRGKKRKSIDSCIGNITMNKKQYGISKVFWDKVKEDELKDETSDDEEDEVEDDEEDEVEDDEEDEVEDDEEDEVEDDEEDEVEDGDCGD